MSTDVLKVFREVIKRRRLTRDLSVREAAAKIGITRTMYHEVETGLRNPSVESLIKIAKFYSASLDYALLDCRLKNQPRIKSAD